MRNFKLLFLSLFLSFAVSCSSSDDNTQEQEQEQENNPSIVGTWKIINMETLINSTTTTPQGNTSESTSNGDASNLNVFVTFTENPNNSTSTGTYSLELTTDYGNGQIVTQTFDDLTFNNFVGEWDLSENQLTISTPLNNTVNATVNLLNETTLSYNSVVEEAFTDSNNNNIVNIITQNIIYNRQ